MVIDQIIAETEEDRIKIIGALIRSTRPFKGHLENGLCVFEAERGDIQDLISQGIKFRFKKKGIE